jgi:hypothetical protein
MKYFWASNRSLTWPVAREFYYKVLMCSEWPVSWLWCVPASWRKTYSALPFSMVTERCNIYWTGTRGCVIRIVMNAAVLPIVTQNGLTEVVVLFVRWTVHVFCLCMRGEIYTIVAFWVVGPISLIGVFHCIGWSCCMLLWFILKMEAACCCEVLVTTL